VSDACCTGQQSARRSGSEASARERGDECQRELCAKVRQSVLRVAASPSSSAVGSPITLDSATVT